MPAPSPNRGGAGQRGDGGAGEGGSEHLALETDIDDPRALGIEPGECRENERCGERHRRAHERQQQHAHAACRAGADHMVRKDWPMSPRATPSSMPQTKITTPSATVTTSRVMAGMWKESAAPPWFNAPRQGRPRVDDRGQALRPRSRQNLLRSAVRRCCAPNNSLIAIRPAKAPPLHTASRIIHGTRMSAACAVSGLMPAARERSGSPARSGRGQSIP